MGKSRQKCTLILYQGRAQMKDFLVREIIITIILKARFYVYLGQPQSPLVAAHQTASRCTGQLICHILQFQDSSSGPHPISSLTQPTYIMAVYLPLQNIKHASSNNSDHSLHISKPMQSTCPHYFTDVLNTKSPSQLLTHWVISHRSITLHPPPCSNLLTSSSLTAITSLTTMKHCTSQTNILVIYVNNLPNSLTVMTKN